MILVKQIAKNKTDKNRLGILLTEILSIDYNFKIFKIDVAMLFYCIIHTHVPLKFCMRLNTSKTKRSQLSRKSFTAFTTFLNKDS